MFWERAERTKELKEVALEIDKLRTLLEETRKRIEEIAAGDEDDLFYANRYIFARLQLDERRSKAKVRQVLVASQRECTQCGEVFKEYRGLHLHRLNSEQGYRNGNCTLLHPACHRELHKNLEEKRHSEKPTDRSGPKGLRSLSKRSDNKRFLYWWDIAPGRFHELHNQDVIEFVQKDTGLSCQVECSELLRVLELVKPTTRGQGNYGIKVYPGSPNLLTIESGEKDKDDVTLPVEWASPEDTG